MIPWRNHSWESVSCFDWFFFFNIYLFLRERQRVTRGGAEREGDTESGAGSSLWAVSTEPDAGLKLMNCEFMTWAEVGSSTDWATQAPLDWLFNPNS